MKLPKSIFVLTLITALLGFTSDAKAQSNTGATMHLDARQQSIVTIASLTAKGDLANLKTALIEGLEAGPTIQGFTPGQQPRTYEKH